VVTHLLFTIQVVTFVDYCSYRNIHCTGQLLSAHFQGPKKWYMVHFVEAVMEKKHVAPVVCPGSRPGCMGADKYSSSGACFEKCEGRARGTNAIGGTWLRGAEGLFLGRVAALGASSFCFPRINDAKSVPLPLSCGSLFPAPAKEFKPRQTSEGARPLGFFQKKTKKKTLLSAAPRATTLLTSHCVCLSSLDACRAFIGSIAAGGPALAVAMLLVCLVLFFVPQMSSGQGVTEGKWESKFACDLATVTVTSHLHRANFPLLN